jgi:quercetin dioxygenase-like cupin family protein
MNRDRSNGAAPQVGGVSRATGMTRLLILGGALMACALWTVNAQAKEKAKAELITTAPSSSSLKWGPCPPIFAKGCEVAVLSGDPAKGMSDVFLRTPANFDLPPHFHNSPEHVVLVQGKFSVTFEGGRRAEVSQGAYTLIPGGMPHSARCEDGEPCVIFIGFEKPVDAILKGGKAAGK